MKKGICLSAVVLSVCCAFGALAGCSAADKGKGSLGLSYEKKYVYSEESRYSKSDNFIIFHKNGTGENRISSGSVEGNSDNYTVFFKYLYYPEENTVFCFYDSVVYEENHVGSKNVTSNWTRTYLCTEELISSPSGTFYICEDYKPNLPNYGKKTSE